MAREPTPWGRISSTLGDAALLLLGVAVILGLGAYAGALMYTVFTKSLSSTRPSEWVITDYLVVVSVGTLGLGFLGFLVAILFQALKGLRATTGEVAEDLGEVRERRRERARGRAWRAAERERLEREHGGALSMSEGGGGGGELTEAAPAEQGALEEAEARRSD